MWWLSLLQQAQRAGQDRRAAEEAQAPASTMPRYGARSGNVNARQQAIEPGGIDSGSMAGDESEPVDDEGAVTARNRDRRRGFWGQAGKNILNRYLSGGGGD